MDYIDRKYSPSRNDLICKYYIEPSKGICFEDACVQMAAESSVGTWTDVSTLTRRIGKMGAKVFSLDSRKKIAFIAYPSDLFEKGNLPQIFSGIAGNIFGMRAVNNLRLLDVTIPASMAKGFPGPVLGMDDLRIITKIKQRPLAGTIYKPKVGMNPREMAEMAYKIYSSGIDYSKDDENLGSMGFNRFEERVRKILSVIDKIKSEQGRIVIYAPNITAPADEMLKRAEFVKSQGGRCIMIDIFTAGWSGIQYIRKQNYQMIIHGHRAGHAAFTRNKRHGISMLVMAKFARLAGISALHTGTVVGKMEGTREEVVDIDSFLRSIWLGKKKVMPIASGGLHPGHVSKLVNILGNDIIINFGGGLWGHPSGPEAGAKAIRQSIDAAVMGISAREYAKVNWELGEAINKWGAI
jgi:ribulose-bisphosphate carboxylase large chain